MCNGCVLRICQRREDAAECDIWQGINSCKYQISGSTNILRVQKTIAFKLSGEKINLCDSCVKVLPVSPFFGFFIPHYQGTDLCYSSRSDLSFQMVSTKCWIYL